MVTFSHQDDGTAEALWAAAGPATPATPANALPIAELRRLVVVAAHPDDETLGAGGLLARAARLGVPVTVVVLSNGEASHPGSATHSQERLAGLRRGEVQAAVAVLAPHARLRLLDLPDGALAEHGEEAARAVAAEVAALGGAGGPGSWIVAPWRMDGHPDHAAAGEAAHAAARLGSARVFEYPIWAWHWSAPDDPVWSAHPLFRLDLAPGDRELKARAMELHRSQVGPLSKLPGDEPIIPPSFSAHFNREYETFIETETLMETEAFTAGIETAGAAQSLTEPFFDDFYAGGSDPWGFETRWYEKRKRALTLAALPRERFDAALELGCSIGVLTAELADRCATVVAVDIAEEPLRIARARLAGRPGVTFTRRTLPAQWPEGTFDLIVLSEVGYYFSLSELRQLLERCRSSLAPNGVLLACHWRHPVAEYPLGGDQVHEELGRLAGLARTVAHRERDFLLEVFEPAPAQSVAQREGLAP